MNRQVPLPVPYIWPEPIGHGVYLSFMSGNTTRAAVLLGRGAWQQVAPAIGVIAMFGLWCWLIEAERSKL